MLQPIRYGPRVKANRNEIGAVRVSEIVTVDLRQMEAFKTREEVAQPDVLVIEWSAIRSAEDQAVFVKPRSPLPLLFHLPATGLPEGVNDFRGQGDCAPRAVWF